MTIASDPDLCELEEVITQLEDDGPSSATIRCKCPNTKREKTYVFMSSDLAQYRSNYRERCPGKYKHELSYPRPFLDMNPKEFAAFSIEIAWQFLFDMICEDLNFEPERA